MKLRQCMKTLKSAGVTIDELKQYIEAIGFDSLEADRKAKLDDYRRTKATDRKRVLGLQKATEAKATLRKATNTVKTPKGTKEVLTLE